MLSTMLSTRPVNAFADEPNVPEALTLPNLDSFQLSGELVTPCRCLPASG
jgi:hypothetical protein